MTGGGRIGTIPCIFLMRLSSFFAAICILAASPSIFAGDNTRSSTGQLNQLTQSEKEQGWKLLFNGKNTDGWRGFKKDSFPEKGWTVENGVLHLEPGSKAGDIISDDKFSQFDLTWEWKIPAKANNGLKYFIIEERGQAIGHEYQMIDNATVKDHRQATAAFYDVLAPEKDIAPLIGEWNKSRILVKGNHVEHWLNGEKMLDYELGSDEVKKAVANSKFKAVEGFGTLIKGHILLTYHNDEVSYRNIKIKDLAAGK